MDGRRPRVEEFSLNGRQIWGGLEAAWRAVVSRRVVLKTRSGRILLWLPLFLFGPLTILEPFWVLLAALILLALGARLSLERTGAAASAAPPEGLTTGPQPAVENPS